MNANAQFNPWPDAEHLGRVCVGMVNIRAKPSATAESVGVLYEDAVVVWLREVIGEIPGGVMNARWVETPDGFIYSPSLQPVKIVENSLVSEIPQTNIGNGFWAEVTIPYIDLIQANPPARSPWLKEAIYPRLYYSQIIWIDDMKVGNDGENYYRVNERYGYGDIFWANAKAFRPLTDDDVAPINPEIENKKIYIDVTPTRQYLTCLEDDREVFYCKISSGAKWNRDGQIVESWGTPPGVHRTWRKQISTHMTGGTTGGGWDIPGVGWTILFSGDGVAIHSTFWHNDYGTPRSHGCVNVKPEDSQWIFRWSYPIVPADPGDITIPMPGGTQIDVREF
ncbi:MAG TPA: L,D-transpeptidase [Anaerolineaceae bacterium]|nr:L,D-transpeptidase [Anaerolineaceae bacterium]